ncbi:MAG: DUF2887 domain-containing protein [Caldilineaceae bacterium]
MSHDNRISIGRWLRSALLLLVLCGLAWLAPQATPVAYGADPVSGPLSGTVPATYPAWWQQVKSANQKSLNALWGDSTQGFFAVGDDGLILRSTRTPGDPNMDNSWLVMPSNTTARLLTIWGSDKNNLFAGGANGTILSYNGSAWSTMNITPTIHIIDLWGVSPTNLYAVGFRRTPPPFFTSEGLVLHYNGQSWQVIHRDIANDWQATREVATFFEQRPHLKDSRWQAIVLWVNITDDPGFGALHLLARKPKPNLVSLDLIDLLKKLPETSLTLNVLRPLLTEDEREVRENVVQWVENIRQATGADTNLEERLISVFSQLIEQKFKTLNYKELSQMLRLTPLRETTSGQELLKEERIDTLLNQIEVKFGISPEMAEKLTTELAQLDVTTLKALLRQLLRLETLEQLQFWIADHLPQQVA